MQASPSLKHFPKRVFLKLHQNNQPYNKFSLDNYKWTVKNIKFYTESER